MLKYKSRFAIRYTPEFRRQMVELVQAGRDRRSYPESLVVRLGHQGALSVVELKVLKLRLLQGREAKAKRGELIRVLAPRYVCDLAGNMVKDPNLRVQEAIALVFKKFRELGSIRQTYRWFHEDNIELPVNKAVAGRFQLAWKLSANALALPLLRITLSKIFLIFCLLLSGSYAGGGGRRRRECHRLLHWFGSFLVD